MKIAVVFVHGFTGGADTWRNSLGNSFGELLGSDPTFANAFDFFEFEYFTKLTGFFNSAPLQKIVNKISFLNLIPGITGKVKKNRAIAQLSEQLSSYLSLRCDEYSEVILIAHSMGGLISKEHVLSSHLQNCVSQR